MRDVMSLLWVIAYNMFFIFLGVLLLHTGIVYLGHVDPIQNGLSINSVLSALVMFTPLILFYASKVLSPAYVPKTLAFLVLAISIMLGLVWYNLLGSTWAIPAFITPYILVLIIGVDVLIKDTFT